MKKWNKFLVTLNNFFILPILFILYSASLFSFFNKFDFSVYGASILLTLIMIDLCFLILFGIIGKSNISYVVLFAMLFMIFIINQIKITYMAEPLFFSDFMFVGSGSNLLKIISGTLLDKINSLRWYFLILIIVFCILAWYASKIKIQIYHLRKRIIYIFVGVLGLFLLFCPFSWGKSFYRSLFFDCNDNRTTYVSLYSFYGVIGGMYYQLLDSRFEIPDDYNEDELNDILVDASLNTTTSELGTPNIIVILSESFFDVNLLSDDITFDKEITSNFNNLKNEGYLVNLVSPSYGGMTANVTFELLTGGNMSYFSNGYIPFMQLYGNNASKLPSIVKELSNNGYYSQIIMGQDSYNSENVLTILGFDEYVKLDVTDENKKGYYVSDDYVSDLIIQQIEEKNKKRKFLMFETMQSHMDYLISKYDDYDISILNSNLSDIDNDVLLSYAQGIYDADKMLLKVYNEIQKIDDDTIVVFFGDHLPYLENVNGDNVLNKLQYFNTGDSILDLYRLYSTQALILSNYDLEINLSDNLGFDLLLTTLINYMDIEISSYYKWLYATSEVLPAYNRYLVVDKNSNLCRFNQLSGEELEKLNLRNAMMHKMFIVGQ